jgi:hypothetical protein
MATDIVTAPSLAEAVPPDSAVSTAVSAADPSPEARALAQRHNGITPERQRVFIEVLAATGSVAEAARQAGASRQAFYAFRNRDGGRDFGTAWDHALSLATEQLCDVAYERALYGVEEPVFYHGEQIGTRRRYNDRLLMMLLRVRAGVDYATLSERRGWQTVSTPVPSFERRVRRLGGRRRARRG